MTIEFTDHTSTQADAAPDDRPRAPTRSETDPVADVRTPDVVETGAPDGAPSAPALDPSAELVDVGSIRRC